MASYDDTRLTREGEFFLESAQFLLKGFEGVFRHPDAINQSQPKNESGDDSRKMTPRSDSSSRMFGSTDAVLDSPHSRGFHFWPKKWKLPNRHHNDVKRHSEASAVATDPSSMTDSAEETEQMLVDWCIEQIDKVDEPLRLKGIYRVSGNASLIARLQVCFQRQLTPDFDADLYSIADLLKRHFRNRQPPLFPPGRFQDAVFAACNIPDHSEKFAAMREAMATLLPPGHFELCRTLFRHLWQISKYESITKMTTSNLATFWAPNLFYFNSALVLSGGDDHSNNNKRNTTDITGGGGKSSKTLRSKSTSTPSLIVESAAEIQVKIQVVETMIKHFEEIFMQQ